MAGLNEQGGAELRCWRGESTRESMMRTAVAQGVSQEARRLG